MAKRAVILVVLDGWGIGREDESNAIYGANPKNLNYIRLHYPAGALQASGIAVGLPWGEPGSSEVGHMTLGAGRVLYQDYPRISLAVRDGSFFKNEVLLRALEHARTNGTKINFVGLLSGGSEHSALEHLEALVKMAEDNGVRFALHLFTDGIDSPPRGAPRLLSGLPPGTVGSISGRQFAMDKDGHWEKTKRCYEVMIGSAGSGVVPADATTILNTAYQRGLTDEFINPSLLREELKIGDGDSLVFFNFREDGIRQLAEMFVDKEAGGKMDLAAGVLETSEHPIPENLHLASFTNYGQRFDIPVAFPQEKILKPLGRVMAEAGKTQLRIAETQKYAHVTYFFNGMDEAPLQNEYRVIIPSREEAQIDKYPEMRIREVGARVLAAINEGVYDFILVNFANADVMAHTGNVDAVQKAVAAVDEQVGLLLGAVLESGSALVLVSDHGNAETVLDIRTGIVETAHNTSPVPIYLVAGDYKREKTDHQAREIERVSTGTLADVAPTILELAGVLKPAEMTGTSLLRFLQ
jgi:2,3-bisphosphoglycerate-independent phosphoglycerate mutase